MSDSNQTVVPEPNRPAASAAAPAPTNQPERIGRYRVEKVLGEGGFGRVYLAHDDPLNRPVAIKVPHSRFVAQATDAESYLVEARTVASLDHPNIVPVYDVGSTEQFPCFTVSKYVDGTDLAARVKQSRMSLRETVEVVATVAEALHYAHKCGLVHRDIKPSNILLDHSGKPFVGDFGLALREQDIGKGPRYAGTPAYMSPEQARGEGHRVDGRSDVFSLGVVFYELLVGRRPFKADSQAKLLEQIKSVDVKPPRQIDDKIPKELERICLKALAKRASDRYTTQKDMADDLRHFLAHATPGQLANVPSSVDSLSSSTLAPGSAPAEAPLVTPTPITPTSPSSSGQHIKIVPKGLRSFDAHDADFFLELLPGPRDREGLPDSLRFWKTRIEEKDPDHAFLVGLIYGPSGCGKSSLVKAGLLPRLSDDVLPVYVEATATDTESRLLLGLRKRCRIPAGDLGLKETLAAVRRGEGIPAGKRVLIVVDQFEQWLHANREQHDTELVQALRQCDGGRVQCIVMVRDDFWMAATRFMRELEVRLVEDDNSSAVDLFDLNHAKNVLTAFGRAFGRLPEKSSETSSDQRHFLDRAVSGLAEEGKVVCVRMALFAEMMKGRPWTQSSLKEVGGTEGVGVTFLEETFNAATAPPEHRYYQKAARAVLNALLPESGTDIKGHMRSYDELLAASGYSGQPKEFDNLIRILDSETRLITPTDPAGADAESQSPQSRAGKFFQLTHDYLVAALRQWLTRKQQETRRGRAELLLADRSAVWNTKPESRLLPSTGEYLRIRLLTRPANWSPPQRKMMRTAGRFHGLRGLMLAAALSLISAAGITARQNILESQRATRAEGLVNGLIKADTRHVPEFVKDLAGYRSWADPLLTTRFEQSAEGSTERLHAALALVASDPRMVGYLREQMLSATPQQFLVIRDALGPHRAEVVEPLWKASTDRSNDARGRFQAACALAAFAPDDNRWSGISRPVAEFLTAATTSDVTFWRDALRGAKQHLTEPLSIVYSDPAEQEPARACAAAALADYLQDRPVDLFNLLATAEPYQFETMLAALSSHRREAIPMADAELRQTVAWKTEEAEKEALARRQVNAAAALIRWGSPDNVWPMLRHSADPRMRSYLIHAVDALEVSPQAIIDRWEQEPDATARAALAQMLAEFTPDRLPISDRKAIVEKLKLAEALQSGADPGLHSSLEWLLRQWGALPAATRPSGNAAKPESRRWYVDSQGQTFAIVDATEFMMGSPDSERGRGADESRHSVKIGRRIAVATTLVSRGQYRVFQLAAKAPDLAGQTSLALIVRTDDSPQTAVTWYEATQYCNWLSDREGFSKCYEPNSDGKYGPGMKPVVGYLNLSGYRLPTEAEWEFACRAGTITSRCYGSSPSLLPRYAHFAVNESYAHFAANENRRTWPVALLKPNDFGLFDVHGNAWQWCDDAYRTDLHQVEQDAGGAKPVVDSEPRVLRGGSFDAGALYVRSAARLFNQPSNRLNSYGFRPVRTISPLPAGGTP